MRTVRNTKTLDVNWEGFWEKKNGFFFPSQLSINLLFLWVTRVKTAERPFRSSRKIPCPLNECIMVTMKRRLRANPQAEQSMHGTVGQEILSNIWNVHIFVNKKSKTSYYTNRSCTKVDLLKPAPLILLLTNLSKCSVSKIKSVPNIGACSIPVCNFRLGSIST